MLKSFTFKAASLMVIPLISLCSGSILGYEYVYIKFISPFFYKEHAEDGRESEVKITSVNKPVEFEQLKTSKAQQKIVLNVAYSKKSTLETILAAEETQKEITETTLKDTVEEISKIEKTVEDAKKSLYTTQQSITTKLEKQASTINKIEQLNVQLIEKQEILSQVQAKKAVHEAQESQFKTKKDAAKLLIKPIEDKITTQKNSITDALNKYQTQLEKEEQVRAKKQSAEDAYIEAERKYDEKKTAWNKAFKDKTDKQTELTSLMADKTAKEAQVPTKQRAKELAEEEAKRGKDACEKAIKSLNSNVDCDSKNIRKAEEIKAITPYQVLSGLKDKTFQEFQRLKQEIADLDEKIKKETVVKQQLTSQWTQLNKDNTALLKAKKEAEQAKVDASKEYEEAKKSTESLKNDHQNEIPKLAPLYKELSDAIENYANLSEQHEALALETTQFEKAVKQFNKEMAEITNAKGSESAKLTTLSSEIKNLETEVSENAKTIEENEYEYKLKTTLLDLQKSSLASIEESISKNKKSIDLQNKFITHLSSETEAIDKQFAVLDQNNLKSKSTIIVTTTPATSADVVS